MADKPTLDEIDALFKNEYFQEKLKRRLFRTPYNVVASVGAFIGITGLAAGIVIFNNKVTGLNDTVANLQKTVHLGQSEIEKLRKEADAAKEKLKEDFSHAKVDLDKEVTSVKDQGVGLVSSAAAVTGAVKLAADSVRGAQASLDKQQQSLLQSFAELDRDQARNKETQQDIDTTQRKLQLTSQLLTDAKTNADHAITSAQQLQQKVQDLSSFKTFEIVTLRSHALKRIELKHIRSADAPPADYTLEFQSHGLRKPVEITVTVHRNGAEGELLLTYPEVAPNDPLRDRWPTFCICGTPWMFQGESWVQSPFVRDFLTMRVVGKQGSCELPRGYLRAECADVSSEK